MKTKNGNRSFGTKRISLLFFLTCSARSHISYGPTWPYHIYLSTEIIILLEKPVPFLERESMAVLPYLDILISQKNLFTIYY